MQVDTYKGSGHFKDNVRIALDNPTLKSAIRRTTDNAEGKRAAAIADFPNFEGLRQQGQAIKDHVIRYLDHYLQQFVEQAEQRGAIIHWANAAEEASQIVVDICESHQARSVTRSKSMLGEEIGLPHALDNANIERVETDLAEHIIQLANDPPSHIVWPAMHRSREEVIKLFREYHRNPTQSEEVGELVNSARRQLREKFLNADIGISGANFLLADTGAVCTVTNEGNAELTTTPPRVHIVTAGIEKLVPSLSHTWPLLRLLVRSATGGEITQYTTFHNGPKRNGDADGPEEFHIVLVDNGRSKLLQQGMSDMLRCIRCGACMNHCVVYKHIGGHAYGGTYPGPMGSVLTPVFDGLPKAKALPHACTLNGRCGEVCPVNIPLPSLLRRWRMQSWQQKLEPVKNTLGVKLFVWVAKRPRLYRLGSAMDVSILRLFSKLFSTKGWITRLPFISAWTEYRDFPAPQGKTFMQQYRRQQNKNKGGS